MLPGMLARTMGTGSRDLEGSAMVVPPIGIANCLAAGCARCELEVAAAAVEEVVERRATLAKDCRTALRKQCNNVKQKTRPCGRHRVHAIMHHHQVPRGANP